LARRVESIENHVGCRHCAPKISEYGVKFQIWRFSGFLTAFPRSQISGKKFIIIAKFEELSKIQQEDRDVGSTFISNLV